MAKKQVSSSGRISPKAITFKPPLKGLNDHAARNMLPPQASEWMLNIVPRDRLGVLRISKRVGFAKAFATPFDGGGSSSSSVEPTSVSTTYTFDGGNLSVAGNYTPDGNPGVSDRVVSIDKIASGGSNSGMWDFAGGTIAAACSFDSGSNTMSGLTLGGSLFIGGGRLTDGIGAGGGIVKLGTGTLALSGTASSYDTATVVLGGLLYSDPDVQAVPVDGDIIVIDGSFDIAGTPATAGNLMLANGVILFNSEIRVHGNVVCSSGACTIGPGVGGVGTLSIDGTSAQGRFDILGGTMDLQSAFYDNGDGENLVKSGGGTLILSQPATFSGDAAYVQEGILKLGVSGALPSSANMTIGSGGVATFDLGGYDQVLDRIFDNNNSLVMGNGTLTLNPNVDQLSGGDVQYENVGLAKAGTNTLVYTTSVANLSSLRVSGGIFRLANGQDFFGSDQSYIDSGATFDANGFSTSLDASNFHVSSGGMLYLPNGSVVNGGLLNGLNAITVPAGVHVTFDVALETGTSIYIDVGSTASGSIVTNGKALALDGAGTFDGSVT